MSSGAGENSFVLLQVKLNFLVCRFDIAGFRLFFLCDLPCSPRHGEQQKRGVKENNKICQKNVCIRELGKHSCLIELLVRCSPLWISKS